MEQQRHLIQEFNDELDWATEEVARTERIVMELEVEYNQKIAALTREGTDSGPEIAAMVAEKERRQERLDLGKAYALQTRALSRFALLSRVYEIGCGGMEAATLERDLAAFLFRSSDDLDRIGDARRAVSVLATALFAYFHVAFDDANDRAVAAAWLTIEDVLRQLGREI